MILPLALCTVLISVLFGYERVIRILRTELNTCRANEQLLLSRLQSRSLGEYTAIVSEDHTIPVKEHRYVYDPTGLIQVDEEDF